MLDEIRKEAAEKLNNQRKQYALTDFVYNLRDDRYWCIKDAVSYSKESVNSMVPRDQWERELAPGKNDSVREIAIRPSSSIARVERDSVVEAVTWWPGQPRIIKDLLITADGDRQAHGRRALNLYVEPEHLNGASKMAALWVEHLRHVWGDEADLLMDYFAHTVQRPFEKINYGLVLLGEQGIGKDTALLPVRAAVGEWNCREISPDHLFSAYSPWKQSVMLIVNEARPAVEEHKATAFYELLKTLCAAPPCWLPMNDKYEKERYVRNLMRVVITSNHPYDLYIPEGDRRLHLVHSTKKGTWATPTYFRQLYDFYAAGGIAHVASLLMERDISKFNPEMRPAGTAAWQNAVASWNTSEVDPLRDMIESLGNPICFFAKELMECEAAGFDHKDEMAKTFRGSRRLFIKMAGLGYAPLRSSAANGEWQFKFEARKFRSRLAFVKSDYDGDAHAAVNARGKELVETGRVSMREKIVPIR